MFSKKLLPCEIPLVSDRKFGEKHDFWTFLVDLEYRAEQCECTFIWGLISTIVFFENMELCLLRSHQMLKKHKKFHQKTSK